MIRFFRMLENVFAAAAFAEAGDFDTAREMVKKQSRSNDRTGGPKATRPRARISA